MNQQQRLDLLARSFLFGSLPAGQLRAIEATASLRRYSRGAPIFFEGDPGDGFYMVMSGKVKIFKTAASGKEQTLHIFGPGEPFGEAPVFHGEPFPANAEALAETEALFFPRDAFAGLIAESPSLALNMLAVLSMRLRRFTSQIEHLTLKEAPGRLAAYLLHLREEQRSDQVLLDIPKGQLANLLGASPETLSRILTRLGDEGMIRVDGRAITLLDPGRLKEL